MRKLSSIGLSKKSYLTEKTLNWLHWLRVYIHTYVCVHFLEGQAKIFTYICCR